MAKELEVMAKDYEEIRYTPSGSALLAGVLVNTGNAYGFPVADIADGEEGILVVRCQNVKVAKEAALAVSNGDALYFDTTAREADKTNTNVLVGFANKPALAADTHVYMNFDGRAAFLKA